MDIEVAFGLVGLVAFFWLGFKALREVKRDIERD